MPETANNKLRASRPQPRGVNPNKKASYNPKTPPKKKSGAVGIFITILCLAIVVVCLVPLFIGGDENKQASEPQALASHESIAASSSSNSSLGFSDSSSLVVDDGALQNPIPEGVNASTPKSTTSKQVVIRGDELNKIEENFKKPATQPQTNHTSSNNVAPKVQDNTPQAEVKEPLKVTSPDVAGESSRKFTNANYLTRQDSLVRTLQQEKKAQETKDKAQTAQTLAKASQVQTGDNSSRAMRANEKVKAQEKSSQAVASNTKSSVVSVENVPFSGQAIPGGSIELEHKNQAHFTVQVVAGSNKANLVEVSAGLQGRYWIYETSREGKPWFVLITGEYPNRAAAVDAASLLPSYVKGAKPFVKSFATVVDELHTRL